MSAAVHGTGAGGQEAALLPSDERHMRRALEAARRTLLAGGPPVGACIVRDGQPIATAGNEVIAALDVTAHAEIAAIRAACRSTRSIDLSGCELFTTVEPCPMCLAACHYAGIGRIVFAATLADFAAITGRELCGASWPPPPMRGGCLREESLALLQSWAPARART